MWATLSVTAVSALFLYTTAATDEYGVFCPESAHDNTTWKDIDIGINIWSSSESREDDCFLRVSTLYDDHSSIGSEWVNPSNNIVVMSHGWYYHSYFNKHYIPDQWGYYSYLNDRCVDEANKGDVEKCAPMDHDAQFWIQNGWNVLYLDWVYFAATVDVTTGEERIYKEVMNGKSVNLLYDLYHRAVTQNYSVHQQQCSVRHIVN